MTTRGWPRLGAIVAAGVCAVVWIAPTVVLVVEPIRQGVAPTHGFVITARQWALLAESLTLALAATIVATMIALPAAMVLGSTRRGTFGGVAGPWVLLACLISPMVYGFGWQRLLLVRGAGGAAARVACILTWASWIWPVPAFIVGAAWRRQARGAHEAALLACARWRAFVAVGLPALRGSVCVSMTIVFVVLSGEYAVPHAWGLSVYATDLLAEATASARSIDAIWPAAPPAVCMAVLAAGAARWLIRDRADTTRGAGAGRASVGWGVRGAFAVTWLACTCVPLAGLIWRLGSGSSLRMAWRVHGGDLLASLALMFLAGILATTVAVGLAVQRRAWTVVAALALAFGVFPGSLVGEAVYGLFVWVERAVPARLVGMPPWNDHWLMVSIGLAAKYGWVAFLVVGSVAMFRHAELDDQAALDGASWPRALYRVRLAHQFPALPCAVLIIMAMSLADIATASLVQVSSVRLVSLVLIEAMHRFEDEMLISICLWLVLVALPGAVAAAWVMRRR